MSEESFNNIDTDGDGFITWEELKAFLVETRGADYADAIAAIAKQFDWNADQKLSRKEYEMARSENPGFF